MTVQETPSCKCWDLQKHSKINVSVPRGWHNLNESYYGAEYHKQAQRNLHQLSLIAFAFQWQFILLSLAQHTEKVVCTVLHQVSLFSTFNYILETQTEALRYFLPDINLQNRIFFFCVFEKFRELMTTLSQNFLLTWFQENYPKCCVMLARPDVGSLCKETDTFL